MVQWLRLHTPNAGSLDRELDAMCHNKDPAQMNKYINIFKKNLIKKKKKEKQDSPSSPVVKIPCFHCKGPGFDSWSEN